MSRTDQRNTGATRVEVDQRSRDTRLRLEQVERLLVAATSGGKLVRPKLARRGRGRPDGGPAERECRSSRAPRRAGCALRCRNLPLPRRARSPCSHSAKAIDPTAIGRPPPARRLPASTADRTAEQNGVAPDRKSGGGARIARRGGLSPLPRGRRRLAGPPEKIARGLQRLAERASAKAILRIEQWSCAKATSWLADEPWYPQVKADVPWLVDRIDQPWNSVRSARRRAPA